MRNCPHCRAGHQGLVIARILRTVTIAAPASLRMLPDAAESTVIASPLTPATVSLQSNAITRAASRCRNPLQHVRVGIRSARDERAPCRIRRHGLCEGHRRGPARRLLRPNRLLPQHFAARDDRRNRGRGRESRVVPFTGRHLKARAAGNQKHRQSLASPGRTQIASMGQPDDRRNGPEQGRGPLVLTELPGEHPAVEATGRVHVLRIHALSRLEMSDEQETLQRRRPVCRAVIGTVHKDALFRPSEASAGESQRYLRNRALRRPPADSHARHGREQEYPSLALRQAIVERDPVVRLTPPAFRGRGNQMTLPAWRNADAYENQHGEDPSDLRIYQGQPQSPVRSNDLPGARRGSERLLGLASEAGLSAIPRRLASCG